MLDKPATQHRVIPVEWHRVAVESGDNAPARVELHPHVTCSDCGWLISREEWAKNNWRCPTCQPAAQPANTDDRQADTIPAWALKQHDQLLKYEIATLFGDEAIQVGENAVQCIIRVMNARGECVRRAETRIEVLEAALPNLLRSIEAIMEEYRQYSRQDDPEISTGLARLWGAKRIADLVRAALAAPSGEQEKV